MLVYTRFLMNSLSLHGLFELFGPMFSWWKFNSQILTFIIIEKPFNRFILSNVYKVSWHFMLQKPSKSYKIVSGSFYPMVSCFKNHQNHQITIAGETHLSLCLFGQLVRLMVESVEAPDGWFKGDEKWWWKMVVEKGDCSWFTLW